MDIIKSIPSQLLRIIGPCPPPQQIFQTFPSFTCIQSASDGYVLHFLGYQGSLVTTLDNDILLEGFGATDGRVKDTHSHRAEISGNIATFSILNISRHVYGFAPISV
jgi:hypothetical protein